MKIKTILDNPHNFIWQLGERFVNAIIQFFLGLVVARIIGPNEYGLIALTTVVITFSDLIVNGGLGSALIQKVEIDKKDIDSVYSVTLLVSLGVIFILFVISKYIASFYGEPKVQKLLYIYMFGIFPFAVYGIQRSLLMRDKNYKLMFGASFISLFISGSIGIVLALAGVGVYCMAIQNVICSVLGIAILEVRKRYRFSFRIYKGNCSELIRFGSKMMVSNAIDTSYKNLPTICVPKVYGNTQLGFFTYGRQIPNVIMSTINSAVVTAAFTTFSRKQKKIDELTIAVRDVTRNYIFVAFPIMFGIYSVKDDIILFLLGEEWREASFFLGVFCIAYAFWPIQIIGFQAIAALGKSDIVLIYEIVKKITGIILLGLSMFYSIEIMMYGQIIIAVFFCLIGSIPYKKYLRYGYKEQLGDIIPALISSIIMVAIVIGVDRILRMRYILLELVINIFTGLIAYSISSIVLNKYAYSLVRSWIGWSQND